MAAAGRPWYHLGKVGHILFGAGVLVLVLYVALACWVHVSPVLPLDVTITRAIQHFSVPWLQAVWRW